MTDLRAAAGRLGTRQEPLRSWAATGLGLLAVVALSLIDAAWKSQIIASTVAHPGGGVVAPEPSFVMYRRTALIANAPFVPVDLRADFSLDVGPGEFVVVACASCGGSRA